MSDMGRLAQLAANPQGTSREEIFLAVTSLYRVQGTHLTARERDLMRDILERLTDNVEMTIRIALAERLADDITAPHDLILLLADDRIEVARPLILRSALLSDADMLNLVAEASVAHHEAVAQRPYIGERVCDVLSKSDSETVLLALVKNATAHIGAHAYEALVEKSRRFATLQGPLVYREDLPPLLATRMAEWVSDVLRNHITRHYSMPATKVTAMLNDVDEALNNAPPPPRLTPGEGAQKLIDKLSGAGQLKAGFLVRVLHQGQADLFDLAFARLLELDLNNTRRALYDGGPGNVALACRAVGIDRSVFPTVYNLSRAARGLHATLSHDQRAEVDVVFAKYDRSSALKRLHVAG
ncbi:MAG TPA: DUF2336 domain-containing protein [Rhizomicrobium sp.]|nr:DUF2336 domain-containing protein [Rhizomicrobium sp.]